MNYGGAFARASVVFMVIALVPACALVRSCNKVKERLASASDPGPAPPALVAPTPEEANAFGELFVTTVTTGNEPQISALVDWDGLLNRAASGLDLSQEMREGVITGFKESMTGPGGSLSQLSSTIPTGGSVRFLRAEDRNGEKWAIVRVILGEGGFDHFQLLLTRSALGVRAVDFEVLTGGEPVSEVLRRLLLPFQANQARALAARLTGDSAVLIRHLDVLQSLQRARTNPAEAQAALAQYHRLPDEAKRAKLMLLARIQAVPSVDDPEYRAAIQDLLRYHPNDPTALVHSIDHYVLREQPALALISVERLAELRGPDPYFDVIRANLHTRAAKWSEAREAANRALEAERGLNEARWALLDIEALSGNFDNAANVLVDLAARGEVGDANALREAPGYEGFVASPQFARAISTMTVNN